MYTNMLHGNLKLIKVLLLLLLNWSTYGTLKWTLPPDIFLQTGAGILFSSIEFHSYLHLSKDVSFYSNANLQQNLSCAYVMITIYNSIKTIV